MVHGTEGKVSQLERRRVKDLIEIVYVNKGDFEVNGLWTDFPATYGDAMKLTHEMQLELLAKLRYVHPERMKLVESRKRRNITTGHA